MLMKYVELSNKRWLKITVDRKRDRAVMF